MEKIVNVSQMKMIEIETIENKKLPSIVLIENAANSMVSFIETKFDRNLKIAVFAGHGNNGADAICIARILTEKKYMVDLYTISAPHKRSNECLQELDIAKNYQVNFADRYQEKTYDLIIDGIFGIGLNRIVTDVFFEYITYINKSKGIVLSIDIPSGINGNNGSVMGVAVKADYTITFAYKKVGLLLNEGPNYSGTIICKNIGLFKCNLTDDFTYINSYEKTECPIIPKRKITGNKGSFGKVLIFAGSKEYGGAVNLVSLSTYRTGAGMVHIITHSDNKQLLIDKNPEALISCFDEDDFYDKFKALLLWADVIVAGPGIGLKSKAEEIFKEIIIFLTCNQSIPFIIDADALTFLANNMKYLEQIKQCKNVICTPHVKEFSRLIDVNVSDVKENMIELVSNFSKKWGLITVCKDAKTFVYEGSTGKSYLNQSGNNGMGTAGSGDVLTGMIASLISQGMDSFEAAYTGVHMHGLTGDFAEQEFGRGLIATDLIHNIKKIF